MRIVQRWTTNISGRYPITAVDIDADGRTVAVAGIDNVVACLRPDGMVRWKKRVGNQAWRVAISDDGRRIAAATGNTQYWHRKKNRDLWLFSGNGEQIWRENIGATVFGLCISGDGHTIAIGTEHPLIRLYSHTSQRLWEERINSARLFPWVWTTSLSKDGERVISGSGDQQIRLLSRGGELLNRKTAAANIHTVSMAGDGTRAAAADLKGNIYGFHGVTGDCLWEKKVKGAVSLIQISHDGSRILVGADADDRHLHLYDADGRLIWRRHMAGKYRYVTANNEANLIMVGTADGRIRFFDEDGNQIQETIQLEAGIRTGALAGNGRLAVVAAQNGNLYGFNLDFPTQTAVEKRKETIGHTFGQQVKFFRKQTKVEPTGKPLTQFELAEQIGRELGGDPPSHVTISNWERDVHTIDRGHRAMLIAIIQILYRHDGLQTPTDAEGLLAVGDYRGLSRAERKEIFGFSEQHTVETKNASASTEVNVSELSVENLSPISSLPQLSPSRLRDYARLTKWAVSAPKMIHRYIGRYGSNNLRKVNEPLTFLILLPALIVGLISIGWHLSRPSTPSTILISGIAVFVLAGVGTAFGSAVKSHTFTTLSIAIGIISAIETVSWTLSYSLLWNLGAAIGTLPGLIIGTHLIFVGYLSRPVIGFAVLALGMIAGGIWMQGHIIGDFFGGVLIGWLTTTPSFHILFSIHGYIGRRT